MEKELDSPFQTVVAAQMGENPGGEEVPLISMLQRLISSVNPADVSKDIDAEGKPQVVYQVQQS